MGRSGSRSGSRFLSKASSTERAAGSAEFREDFVRKLDDATSQRRIGAVALTAGTALAIGGIYVFVRHRHASHQIVGGIAGRSIYVAGWF